MTTRTLTLTEFLLARIAEDEAALICCHGPGCANQDYGFALGLHDCDEMVVNPKRWSAECEAKRRTVLLHQEVPAILRNSFGATCCDTCSAGGEYPENSRGYPCDTIKTLAAIYADHPDYDETWRP